MKRQTGFTLIEIMITVLIVAIIAAIAIPSYRNYVLKAHRSDAEAALTQVAQIMEKQYTANNTYLSSPLTSSSSCPYAITPTSTVLVPNNFSSVANYYDLSVNACGSDSFTLWAKPKTVVAGSGLLSLDNTGLKHYNPTNDTAEGSATWP